MEVAGTEDDGQDEEQSDPGIQCATDGPPHQGLAESADECEHVPDKVELADLDTHGLVRTGGLHDLVEFVYFIHLGGLGQ